VAWRVFTLMSAWLQWLLKEGMVVPSEDAVRDLEIPSHMRALVLGGTGFTGLSVRRVPTPQLGPRQLLARVDAAGICTSLLKLIEQGPDHRYVYGWDITRYPLILGDEGAVTLVKIGEELRARYCPGQRYVIQPAVDHPPINHRERYRNGARGVDKIAVGYTLGGHLAEYVLVTEEILAADCLRPIPSRHLPYAHAAVSEPFSCVISSQDHHIHLVQESPVSPRTVVKGLKPGGLTVIVGVGAMGRMHIDLALSSQPRAILAVSLSERRLPSVQALFRNRARALGIGLFTSSVATTDVSSVVDRLSEGRGADDVIVAAAATDAIEAAQHWVGRGGVLNIFGGLRAGEDTVGLSAGIIHYKETIVTGSSGGSPHDIDHTLQLMANGSLDPAKHIARIGDLAHAIELLEMMKAHEIDGKAVVYPHRRSERVLAVSCWTDQDEQAYLAGSSQGPPSGTVRRRG